MNEIQARRTGIMVVMSGWLAVFMLFGVRSTFAILKIPMAKELHWSDSSLVGGYALMMFLYGITAFLSGMIVDRWGAKPCYFLAAIFGLASLWLTAGVHGFQTYLVVYGVLGGIATGMCWVSSTVSVRKWYIGKDYAKMWGFAFAGAPMAQVLLSLLCRQLMPIHGWRITARTSLINMFNA